LLGHRLKAEILAPVPHRQWVFTIPKRLRRYFRFNRSLLGKLCRAAWETVQEVYAKEVDGDCGVPAMVGAVQTFGDLIHWHSHVHTIVSEGVFTSSGYFVHIPDIWRYKAVEIWQEKVFDLLQDACLLDMETVASMRGWRHSGFHCNHPGCSPSGGAMHRALRASLRYEFALTIRCALVPETMTGCSGW